jgi:ABC-type nitrate/sulfonate/bicarbonate transport system substrate-binding protein
MRLKSATYIALIFSIAVVSPLSAQLKKVRFSVSATSIAELPFRIAHLKGFYREEGLDVEVILIRGAVGMQALLGRSFAPLRMIHNDLSSSSELILAD